MGIKHEKSKPKLTLNEREVLKFLVQNGRGRCTKIAQKLGITSQAVGKIIEKLEKDGFIKGYSVELDYKKLGIEVFAIALFRFKSGVWSRLEEEDIRNRIRGPHLIRAYRLTHGEFTHMIIYGFRSIREVENYFQVLQKEREHISELKKLYVVSAESMIKDSPDDLFLKAISEWGNETLARPENLKHVTKRGSAEAGFFS